MEEDVILIDRLLEFVKPEIRWNDEAVTIHDVEKYIETGIEEEKIPYSMSVERETNKWHIRRIIYFIRHPDEIRYLNIDNRCHDGYILPIPVIFDGNHRFMAAVYLYQHGKMKTISCSYGGRIDVLDYLKGNTDEFPDSWD